MRPRLAVHEGADEELVEIEMEAMASAEEKENELKTKKKLDFTDVKESDIELKREDNPKDDHVVDIEKTLTNDSTNKDSSERTEKDVKEVGKRRRRKHKDSDERKSKTCCNACTIV